MSSADAARIEQQARGYAMVFWFLGGMIGGLVTAAVCVPALFPDLDNRPQIIFSAAAVLTVISCVIGWFATAHARIRRWSIAGFLALALLLKLAIVVMELTR